MCQSLLSLSAIIVMAISQSTANINIHPSFHNPDSSATNRGLTVDKRSGNVFVADGTCVYQLDKNLVMKFEKSLIPRDKLTTDLYKNRGNIALVIDYNTSTIITCTNFLFDLGGCLLMDTSNVSDVKGSTLDKNKTKYQWGTQVAFMVPGKEGNVIYAGTSVAWYEPPYEEHIKTYCCYLNHIVIAVGDTPSTKAYPLVHYVSGFSSMGFSYFLKIRKALPDNNNSKPSQFVTHLGRICQSGEGAQFTSPDRDDDINYAEIPLKCLVNSVEYSLVQSAYVTKPGRDLASALNISDSEDVLFASFAPQKLTNIDSPDAVRWKSALCIYPLKNVHQKFVQNVHNCVAKRIGTVRTNRGQRTMCANTTEQLQEDMCRMGTKGSETERGLLIRGQDPLESKAVLTYDNIRITSVAATSVPGTPATVIYLGTHDGHLKKIVFVGNPKNPEKFIEYDDMVIHPGKPIHSEMHFSPKKDHLYLMNEHGVFQIPAQDCSGDGDCVSCLAVAAGGDPYCGSNFTPILVVSVVTAAILVICVPVVIFIVLRRRKNKSKHNVDNALTKKEEDEFHHGTSPTPLSASSFMPATRSQEQRYSHMEIYSLPFDPRLEIGRDRLKLENSNVLGSGHYGIVMRGLLEVESDGVSSFQPVAVKTTKSRVDKETFMSFLMEIKIMAYVGTHKNVVRLIGTWTTFIRRREAFAVVEFCVNGDLNHYLRKYAAQFRNSFCLNNNYDRTPDYQVPLFQTKPPNLSSQHLLQWSHEIADGMSYLSARNVIHGDLATRNVLLTERLTAKVSDFGLSRQLENNCRYYKKKKEVPLPWKWMAMESLASMQFSIESDIWSYGITLWEIYSLAQSPYPGIFWPTDLFDNLKTGFRLTKPAYASDNIFKIMKDCWHEKPGERPQFQDIMMRLCTPGSEDQLLYSYLYMRSAKTGVSRA